MGKSGWHWTDNLVVSITKRELYLLHKRIKELEDAISDISAICGDKMEPHQKYNRIEQRLLTIPMAKE